MMTYYTYNTMETASMTTYVTNYVQQGQMFVPLAEGGRESPRPKRRGGRPFSPRTPETQRSITSPVGRKSPYLDENSKRRIKTELCLVNVVLAVIVVLCENKQRELFPEQGFRLLSVC